MPLVPAVSVTFLGHSTFLFRSPRGLRVLVDPWLKTNPSCPDSAKQIRELDLMLLTHGHDDHAADAISIARATEARVVAPYELAQWLEEKGLRRVTAMNVGGTIEIRGITLTMVPAFHSSSVVEDGRVRDLGAAVGYVIQFETGAAAYYAGDTGIFGDMRLIGEMYRPKVAFLPIGDLYTMGPEQAARACAMLGIRKVVPMHYGTWPSLTGTPARLRELVAPLGVEVLDLKPGETMET